jgi:hypothetical protein
MAKRYWNDALWSPSYFAASCGGAPISILKEYIEQQRKPIQRALYPRLGGRGFTAYWINAQSFWRPLLHLLQRLDGRSGPLQLYLMRLPQRYARVLEAQLDASAQLSRDVVFPIECRTDLQAKNRSV